MVTKIRYEANNISTKNDPMDECAMMGSSILEVDDIGDQEGADRAAYLRASNRPGQLLDVVRLTKPNETVWCAGMAIPGEVITADMVGLTFAAAIKRSML